MSSTSIKYVPAKHYQKANRTKVEGLAIHTAECAEVSSAAENLQSWTAGPNANVSSWHFAVDNDSITQSCLEKDIAWHAGPANGWSIGIELAGKAAQTPAQWADEYSLAVLENAAHLAADICKRHGIPITRLTAADLKAGKRAGIFGHVDVTNGLTAGKGHQDPGTSFPWESFLARVAELADTTVTPAIIEPSLQVQLNGFVEVEHNGVIWEVCPIYVAPVGIGEAKKLAESLGCELPTPALVDAIWAASDLKIDASIMVNGKHNGKPETMDSEAIHAVQAEKLARAIGTRSLGKDFHLLGGGFKDVVTCWNEKLSKWEIGLYGWHKLAGGVVQGFFSGHSLSWRDYSQGLRLVRKKR